MFQEDWYVNQSSFLLYILNEINKWNNRKRYTIKPQHLNKIFSDCDIDNLIMDFENNNIQNDLLNNWEVVYYFTANSNLTFSIDE